MTDRNAEAFTTSGIQADSRRSRSRQSKWLPLPADADLRKKILLKTKTTALLLKPAENGLDAPTIEYQSLASTDETRRWFDETTATAELPRPDDRGSLHFLAFRAIDFDSDERDDFKDICLRGGPVRNPEAHYYPGFAGLSRYRCPSQTTATNGTTRNGNKDRANEASPDADSRPLQRLVYDMEITTWYPFITSSYFPQSKTTILALTIVMKNPEISIELLQYMVRATRDDHDRAFRDPLLFQHPLSAIMLIISWAVDFVQPESTPRELEQVLSKAGFHQYSNYDRMDAMLIPSRELSKLTSDAVAYSIDLAQSDSSLAGLSRMSRYLRDENEELKRLGYFDSPELQRVRYLIDEWSRYIEYTADNFSQWAKSWHHQANVVIQGLQNVVTQKNQDSTLAIAQESRRIAEASWKDTTSVTAITLITMLFLPATFTATLFSAKFFEDTVYDGDAYRQARTYLATTFPLTATVILVWYGWVTFRRRRANVLLERRQTLEMEENEDRESQWESA